MTATGSDGSGFRHGDGPATGATGDEGTDDGIGIGVAGGAKEGAGPGAGLVDEVMTTSWGASMLPWISTDEEAA